MKFNLILILTNHERLMVLYKDVMCFEKALKADKLFKIIKSNFKQLDANCKHLKGFRPVKSWKCLRTLDNALFMLKSEYPHTPTYRFHFRYELLTKNGEIK